MSTGVHKRNLIGKALLRSEEQLDLLFRQTLCFKRKLKATNHFTESVKKKMFHLSNYTKSITVDSARLTEARIDIV